MTEVKGFSNKKFKWQMYIDSASRKKGSGIGIILIGPERIKIEYTVRIAYHTMNNTVEYEALITRVRLANEVRAESIKVLCLKRGRGRLL